uniref:SMAX1-like nucleotide binding domain-containing protein n=1 Tax=Arundo donax TaxID=35708 RepID=A0A0A8YFB9_ARUDO
MREAGFSSSQVKANVEKAVSSPPDPHPNTTTSSPSSGGHARCPNATAADGDAMRVLNCMASGSKRCVVVVGESVATAEAVVKAVMDRVSKGELQHRHERLKNLQFVPLSAASFQRTPREEVEAKAGDLRALVRQGCAAGKGVVLVLEDLAYAAEAWAAASERRSRGGHRSELGHCYCPVEHAVMEVSSLVSTAGGGSRGLDRFWILGFGNNQAYMKCRAGQPSLEAVWELHPVVVPDGGLALSLSCASEAQQASQERSRTGWHFVNCAATGGESELTARAEAVTSMPCLPPWLRRYQDPDEARPERCSTVLQLQGRNPNCNGSITHQTSELTLSFSSPDTSSPAASSVSGFANIYNGNMMRSSKPWQKFKPLQPWPNHQHDDPMAKSYDHQPLHANPSPESYSVSNSSDGGPAERPKFTELTAENLKILCNTLESRVPRHKDVAANIASTVLQCRSGMTRGRRWPQEEPNAATWLLLQGRDSDGKKAVAQELARLVFGSYTEFISIALSEFTPVYSESNSGELILKRQRSPDNGHGYVQSLYEAIAENPHRVVMVESVEQLDYDSTISIRNAVANGRIKGCNGDEMSLEDAIIVLSCEALDSRSSTSSHRFKQRVIDNDGEEGNGMNTEKGMESSCFGLDLNACADDGEGDEENAPDSVRILNIVDGVFCFQLTEDL